MFNICLNKVIFGMHAWSYNHLVHEATEQSLCLQEKCEVAIIVFEIMVRDGMIPIKIVRRLQADNIGSTALHSARHYTEKTMFPFPFTLDGI